MRNAHDCFNKREPFFRLNNVGKSFVLDEKYVSVALIISMLIKPDGLEAYENLSVR